MLINSEAHWKKKALFIMTNTLKKSKNLPKALSILKSYSLLKPYWKIIAAFISHKSMIKNKLSLLYFSFLNFIMNFKIKMSFKISQNSQKLFFKMKLMNYTKSCAKNFKNWIYLFLWCLTFENKIYYKKFK